MLLFGGSTNCSKASAMKINGGPRFGCQRCHFIHLDTSVRGMSATTTTAVATTAEVGDSCALPPVSFRGRGRLLTPWLSTTHKGNY